MRLHRTRRQAVGDDEGDIVRAGVRCQRRLCAVGQPAPEIGPHQILLPVTHRTRDVKHRQGQIGKVARQLPFIERLVHGVARLRMRQRELKERRGRQRRAAARKSDARGREAPQIVPRVTAGEVVVHAGNNAEKCAGSARGRMRDLSSSSPCRASHASNSGAGFLPRRSRIASASWNDVLW